MGNGCGLCVCVVLIMIFERFKLLIHNSRILQIQYQVTVYIVELPAVTS